MVTPETLAIFVDALAPAVASLLGLVLTAAVNELRRRWKGEAAGVVLDRVERAVELAVAEVNQTIVPAIRAKTADGKLSEEDARSLAATAKTRAMKLLGTKGRREAVRLVDDLGEIVAGMVESKIDERKHGGRGLTVTVPANGRRGR